MLKYQINTRNLHSDLTQLPIVNYKMYDNNSTFNNNMSVELEYRSNVDVKIGDKIRILMELTPEGYYGNTEYYDKEFTVQDIDLSSNKILLSIPRYIDLNIDSFVEKKGDSGDEIIWYIKFKQKHYFNEYSDEIDISFVYSRGSVDKTYTLEKCIAIDEYTIMYTYKDDENDKDVSKYIFESGNLPRGNARKTFVKMFKRDSYLITHSQKPIKFYTKKYQLGITIPFSNTHDISVTKQYDVNERFVNVEKEKVINKPIEMEKSIFVPVCKYWVNGERNSDPSNEQTQDIFKINFNLHLRYHHGKEWQTNDEDFWNGVHRNGIGNLEINEDYFAKPYVEDNNRDRISWQSDLLSKLGFNDADVRYQKTRLKKTFLRLSFYDSPNPGSQNLITYSTIFLDSNKLSGKMIRNAFRKGYKQYDHMNDKVSINLEGIRSARDINFNSIDSTLLTASNCENYRLSSQFSVTDKYKNNDCAEGFYLYLWKDFIEGTIPTDLYLKVELNHGAYGRTIPLMMPYFAEKSDDEWDGQTDGKSWGVYRKPLTTKEKLKEGEGQEGDGQEGNGTDDKEWFGIKSFYDIVNDWNNGGYNIQQFLKYSYIHLKCQFDKNNNRYVYYLDNLFYENCHKIFDVSNGTLNINLYEAKVTDSNITSPNIPITNHNISLEEDNKNLILKINGINNENINLNDFKSDLKKIYFCDKDGYLYDVDINERKIFTTTNTIRHNDSNEYWYISDSGKKQYCDKNGFVLDVNDNGNIYVLLNDNNEVEKGQSTDNNYNFFEKNGITYYCDERGYILKTDDNEKPYTLLSDKKEIYYAENNKYTSVDENDKERYCDINGRFYKLGDDNEKKKMNDTLGNTLHVYKPETFINEGIEYNGFKIYDDRSNEVTLIKYNSENDSYYYYLPLKDNDKQIITYYDSYGNSIEFKEEEEEEFFILPKYGYKCMCSIDNTNYVTINCTKNGYIKDVNNYKFYICKEEYTDDKKYERNYNKIINVETKTTITYKLNYTLNEEHQLWDNYYTIQNYDNNILEDILDVTEGENCRIRLNYFDNDKLNVLNYFIYPITNSKYKDFIEYNELLKIINLKITATYEYTKDNTSYKEQLLSTKDKTINRNIDSIEDNIEDSKLAMLSKGSEFTIEDTIPRRSVIEFLVKNPNGEIINNENYKCELSVVTNISKNNYVEDFYLTKSEVIESYSFTESTSGFLYNRKLEIIWKNINRDDWKHWKFCVIDIKVKNNQGTDAPEDDKVLLTERFYFTFKNPRQREDNYYYSKSRWFDGFYTNQKIIRCDGSGLPYYLTTSTGYHNAVWGKNNARYLYGDKYSYFDSMVEGYHMPYTDAQNYIYSTKYDSQYESYKKWLIYENTYTNLTQRYDNKLSNGDGYKLIDKDNQQLPVFRYMENGIPMGYYHKIKNKVHNGSSYPTVKVFCRKYGNVLINTNNDYRKYREYNGLNFTVDVYQDTGSLMYEQLSSGAIGSECGIIYGTTYKHNNKNVYYYISKDYIDRRDFVLCDEDGYEYANYKQWSHGNILNEGNELNEEYFTNNKFQYVILHNSNGEQLKVYTEYDEDWVKCYYIDLKKGDKLYNSNGDIYIQPSKLPNLAHTVYYYSIKNNSFVESNTKDVYYLNNESVVQKISPEGEKYTDDDVKFTGEGIIFNYSGNYRIYCDYYGLVFKRDETRRNIYCLPKSSYIKNPIKDNNENVLYYKSNELYSQPLYNEEGTLLKKGTSLKNNILYDSNKRKILTMKDSNNNHYYYLESEGFVKKINCDSKGRVSDDIEIVDGGVVVVLESQYVSAHENTIGCVLDVYKNKPYKLYDEKLEEDGTLLFTKDSSNNVQIITSVTQKHYYYGFGRFLRLYCDADGSLLKDTRVACDEIGRLYVRNIDRGGEFYYLNEDIVEFKNGGAEWYEAHVHYQYYNTQHANRYQKIPHTTNKTKFYFIALIIPYMWKGKINYACNYTLPNLTEFNVKMLGVKSYDAVPTLSDKPNYAPFKVECALTSQYCNCCNTIAYNGSAKGYRGNLISAWVKSAKFDTLSSSIFHQVENTGYVRYNELEWTKDSFNGTLCFEPYIIRIGTIDNTDETILPSNKGWYCKKGNATTSWYLNTNHSTLLKNRRYLTNGCEFYDFDYNVVYNWGSSFIIRTLRNFEYQTSSTLPIKINSIQEWEFNYLQENGYIGSDVTYLKCEDYFYMNPYNNGELFNAKGEKLWSFSVASLSAKVTNNQALLGKNIICSIEQKEECSLLNKKIYINIRCHS